MKWDFFIKLLVPIFTLITPEIKKFLAEALQGIYKQAKVTPNPWDDFAVGLLLDLLGIERPADA